jgi:hypothetical protein
VVVNGRNYGGNVIGPMVGEFAIAPATWTRFWVLLVPQPDGQWYQMSMWAADEHRDAVQIYNSLQVRPQSAPKPYTISMGGRWGTFRIEYNTSTSTVKARGPLTSFVRNLVTLSTASVSGLLVRP